MKIRDFMLYAGLAGALASGCTAPQFGRVKPKELTLAEICTPAYTEVKNARFVYVRVTLEGECIEFRDKTERAEIAIFRPNSSGSVGGTLYEIEVVGGHHWVSKYSAVVLKPSDHGMRYNTTSEPISNQEYKSLIDDRLPLYDRAIAQVAKSFENADKIPEQSI
jgi:hypothetical protein